MTPLFIDGSMGEGGGQVLRSSLALSLLGKIPLRMVKIRAGRERPGLMRQHLAAVRAAAEISNAELRGDELGSGELWFAPKAIRAGDYRFTTGGAGSTTLVFQTVLLPLLLGAGATSTLRFEGGTHNPMAPPFDFLALSFLPLLARLGARVEVRLERHGFYPAGGGAWSARIEPAPGLSRLELLERGELKARTATALCAGLPGSIAVRELDALAAALGWPRQQCRPLMVEGSAGPGNALIASVESEHVTEQFTAFGERGRPSEAIAGQLAQETQQYLAAGVPVGEHLADQLLLPLALGSGGVFRTVTPSLHTHTQVELIQSFLGLECQLVDEGSGAWRVEVPPRTAGM